MKFLRQAGIFLFSASLLLAEFGCGEQYRPVANPVITPGGQPQVAHFAWVVSYNPNGDGSTTQIDASGDSNTAVNAMGAGSIAEAFPVNSLALFVANNGNDTVSEYAPTISGPITTISLLAGSHPVALGTAQNSTMFVLNSGANSACPTTGSISAIKTSTLSVTSTTCVGHNPTALAQSSTTGYVYVVNQADGTVSVFNPAGPVISGTITTANGLGQNPVSVTASIDGNWIFIVTQGDGVGPGALDIVSAGTATVAASVPLGVGPTFSIIDPNLNRLYVANTGGNSVSVFNAASVNPTSSTPIVLLGTTPTGTSPVGIAPLANGSLFYVANNGSDTVTVASANSFSALTTVALPTGADPVFIAAEPGSSKVYVADKGTSEITIIQTSNNAIATNIAAPPQVSGCTSSCTLQQPVMIVTQ